MFLSPIPFQKPRPFLWILADCTLTQPLVLCTCEDLSSLPATAQVGTQRMECCFSLVHPGSNQPSTVGFPELSVIPLRASLSPGCH